MRSAACALSGRIDPAQMKGIFPMEYEDYMIRAMAADSQIRAFALTAKDLVEEARKAHNTSPIATAALGRLMCGGLMMADMLKGEKDLITLQVDGDGPLRRIVATADKNGNVKGYVVNPDVDLPLKENGHLDVGGAVGKGTLTVIRDLDMKNAYTGQIELYSGEIADDLTCYFAESEQIPTSVGLGVLIDTDLSVRSAGGFMVQLMPNTSEEVIERLEENCKVFGSVTESLDQGQTPEDMLARVLCGFDVEFTEQMPVHFHCNCCREKTERALILLGRKELEDMIDEAEPVELSCQFCGKKYLFETEDLKKLWKDAKPGS